MGSTSGKDAGRKCFPIGAAPSGLGAVGKRGKFPPTVSGREIRGREFPSALVFSVGTRWARGSRGRGAPGRRNKGLRGVKHHVRTAGGPLGPVDVVLGDERIRACDVLPVNRTMKKYKIYVTSNLNLLLAIFLILRYIFAIQNPSPGGRSAASLRC